MSTETDEQEKEAKFNALFKRAKKGVLAFLNENGGSQSLSDMHEYSLNTFFIQHQRFSQLMETLVSEKLVDYSESTQISTITEEGKKFIQQN